MSLGSFVREKRTAAHLTLGQLARRMGKGWTVVRLSAIEADKALPDRVTPKDIADLDYLSDALDVDFDLLIDASNICECCLGSGKKEE